MTASQPPADGGRNTAPPQPRQQQHQEELPPYSDDVAAEQPTETPVSDAHIPQPDTARSGRTPQSRDNKPEGSQYASSYRPQDARQNPPPVLVQPEDHDFHASQPETPPDQPPPAYSLEDGNNALGAAAEVADDGRVNIRISQNQKSRTLSQLLTPQIQRQITQDPQEPPPPPPYVPEFLGGAPGQEPPPRLNVVIQVVGSRGDVQPFVALGKVLKETYGHRVRLATHPVFKDFVTEHGLEFFSIGGDPAELMAFMVKNPGLMPGFDTMRSGEVGKRRKNIAEMLRGTWRSCIESGDGLGVDPLKQTVEEWMGVEDQLPEALKKPFVADAIIANPPAFGHIHCAEKLGIPLHMMFTYVLLLISEHNPANSVQHAVVSNTTIPSPLSKHSVCEHRPNHHEFHVVYSC
jgi:hypothetical protein